MSQRLLGRLNQGLGRSAFLMGILALFLASPDAQGQDLPWRCADMSFLDELEAAGAEYAESGMPGDALQFLQEKGLSGARLRLFHSPTSLRDGLPDVLQLALRLSGLLGLPWILDIHYSDTWADPGHQTKPASWQQLDFSMIQDSVSVYTQRVLEPLDTQGTRPAIVQIGNEITAGILWNDRRIGGIFDTPDQWSRLAALVERAVQDVRAAVGDSTRIMIHLDRGGDKEGATWLFDSLAQYQVEFDIIGLSYYPWWHGTLEDLTETLGTVSATYGKPILLVETAYPWTLQWLDDTHNIVGLPEQLLPGYTATPEGQRDYIRDVMQIVADTPGGLGVCYWEPAYVSAPAMGSSWENLTLFGSTGEVLPGAAVLGGTLNTGVRRSHSELQSLQIYPNPAYEEFRVAYDQPPGTCTRVIVYDILGRVVTVSRERCQPGFVEQRILVDDLASGVYMILTLGLSQAQPAPIIVMRRKK